MEHRLVTGICSSNNMRPKNRKELHTFNKVTCNGTFFDKDTILRLVGSGICWTELRVETPGSSDCKRGDRLVFSTEIVLCSFDVDGYDTCPHCNGTGMIKHGFRSYGTAIPR